MAQGPERKRVSPPLLYAFRFDHIEDYADSRQEAYLREAEDRQSKDRVIVGQRMGRHGVSEREIRTEVRLNLSALLNTVNLAASIDLSEQEEVVRSIVNFGMPDIRSRSADSASVDKIESEILEALRCYERRLAPGTVRIERERLTSDEEMKIRYRIAADLLCDPVAVPVEFVADIDRDSCAIQVNRI